MILPRSLVLLPVILVTATGVLADDLRRKVSQDPRCDVDLLLVVAHPDDETAIGPQLAQLVVDEKRTVAVVYCTRGTGGGNNAGAEQARALGAIREIEARTALSTLQISHVWFIDGVDTPGQDVFASLSAWNHGNALEDLVRLVRLTRPEVIVTWLPAFVAGENHGDHQAAGVIATEAFDLAGDPTVFPVQVAAPREPEDINNVGEGLHPWQAQKLYFFSDASHPISGDGPAFDVTGRSKALGTPFIELAAQLMLPHHTQGEVSSPAAEALKAGDFSALLGWLSRFRLLFGKSVVPCVAKSGLFDGVLEHPIAHVAPPGYTQRSSQTVTVTLGGPFEFYRAFWSAHGIGGVAQLVEPELEVAEGSYLHIPILIFNGMGDSASVTLKPELPPGFESITQERTVIVPPGQDITIQTFQWAPRTTTDPEEVCWSGWVGGERIGEAKIRIATVPWGLPW